MTRTQDKERVIVTGSCGFIGHHLVKKLRDNGYYVIGVDSLVNGDEKYSDLSHEFYKEDIRTFSNYDNIKYVFHLAALPRVTYSIEEPQETNDVNVNGTLNVLLQSKKAGVKKVIYSSSSSVYGSQRILPIKESATLAPANPYAVQKLAGENYATIFNKVYKLPTISLRYFNIYGEDQDGSHPYATAVAKFLDQYKKGEPITIEGTGEQTRDMTYVGDVVDANILAAESNCTGFFNIGGGARYSINEIAKAIEGGEERERVRLAPRINDVPNTLADIRKASVSFYYDPKMNIKSWIETQVKNIR